MIKVLNWQKKGQNLYAIEAVSDTKEEVDRGDPFVGLPANYDIEMGSTVMTVDGDLAMYTSDKKWNWVGGEE